MLYATDCILSCQLSVDTDATHTYSQVSVKLLNWTENVQDLEITG